MHKGRSILYILILWNPHRLKCGHRSQNRPSNPCQVLSFRWTHHINFSAWWYKCGQFLHQSFWDTREHGRPTAQNNVVIKILPDIKIAFHYRLVHHLLKSRHLNIVLFWLEHDFRTTEALITQCDSFTIRKLVLAIVTIRFEKICKFRWISTWELLITVLSHITVFLLDIFQGVFLSGKAELHSDLLQQSVKVSCDLFTCKIISLYCQWNCVTLVYWYCWCQSFAWI